MSVEVETEGRPRLRVHVRSKVRRRGRCGRCGELVAWLDNGDGVRSWRHLDAGFATVALVAVARRVGCRTCGPTVAQVPWARHDTAFSRAFEDLVVHDAIVGNKQAAADRYGVSWRAVNNMYVRVASEALGRFDLLEGLVTVAIDEVKYKKGHRYLTVVCDHVSGKVIWAAKGRSKDTRRSVLRRFGRPRRQPRVRDRGRRRLDHRRGRRTGPRRHRLLGHVPRHRLGHQGTRRGPAAKSGTSCAPPGRPKWPRSSRGCGSCCVGTGRTSPWANARSSGRSRRRTGARSGRSS